MNFARLVSFVVLFLLLLLLWRVKSGFAGKFMRGFSLNRSVIPFNYTYFILYANKLTTKSIFSLLFFFPLTFTHTRLVSGCDWRNMSVDFPFYRQISLQFSDTPINHLTWSTAKVLWRNISSRFTSLELFTHIYTHLNEFRSFPFSGET